MKVQRKGSARCAVQIAALLMVLVAALAVTACDTGAGAEFVTYTGESGGVRYTLTVTENTARYAAQEGDRYELVRESRRSAGTVSGVSGSLLTLQPEIAPDTTFTASVSGGRLTALNGRITWTDGTTASAPGRMTGSTYYPPYSPPSTPIPDVWRVVYDANGGEGTMDDDTAEVGAAITLSENGFTRTGCTFAGWAESAAGAMLYGEGATVSGGSGASDMNQITETTLKLYALWDVEDATTVVGAALANGDGTVLTLTGVAWSGRLPGEVEGALNKGVTTLDLSGVSGLDEEWDKDTLTNKGNIISLTLPETVTSVAVADKPDNSAFKGYNSLTSVSGKGITDVGDGAFYGLTALTEVSLPTATKIGDVAFTGCTSLTEVSLPAATDIGGGAFYETGLKTVSLPEAKKIGDGAFNGCTKLTEVNLPEAKTIGEYAFQYTALETVSLPEATDIGESAFEGCTALTTVNLEKVETIGIRAFYGCTGLTEVSLPAATGIGISAFQGCSSLTTVSLPVATDIGAGAFYDCTDLIEVSLPVVEDIGNSAFSSCAALTTLSLPKAKTIGESAFYACTGLTDLYLPATLSDLDWPPTLGRSVFYFTGNGVGSGSELNIYVGSGNVSAYTTKWGTDRKTTVAVETAEGANTAAYGQTHKKITIME